MDELKPASCPFCGHAADLAEPDTLYPGARWRDDEGMRHYLLPGDKRQAHGSVWTMHCPETVGGCGAEISGDTREEAIAAWNRRAPTSPPALAGEVRQAMELAIEKLDGYLNSPEQVELADALHAALASPIQPLSEERITARMLTVEEVDAAWKAGGRFGSTFSIELQRKFCEVNGIYLQPKENSNG